MSKGLSSSGALCLCKLFFYSPDRTGEPQNRVIYFIKKNRNKRVSAFLARELTEIAKREIDAMQIDPSKLIVASVPRGKRARSVHGFDQSELIADELAALMGSERFYGIMRSKNDKEQKKLDKSRRFRNVESSFVIKDADLLKDKYVLLFDDIVTTGASMAACCKLLRRAGTKGIFCICLGYDQLI